MLFDREKESSKEEALERLRVKELIEYERFCKDNEVWEGLESCYAKGAKISVAWFQGGSEDFIAVSKKMKTHAPHKLFNMFVRLRKNKAAAVLMMTIDRETTVEGLPAEVRSDAKGVYRAQKIDGEWKILSLDVVYEKDGLTLKYPNNEVSVSPEVMKKYRASYACSSFVIESSGGKVNDEALGVDQPEKVKKLYDETEKWLLEGE